MNRLDRIAWFCLGLAATTVAILTVPAVRIVVEEAGRTLAYTLRRRDHD